MKITKKDIIYSIILIILFCVIYFIFTSDGSLWGSVTDFSNQHSIFPDYLRELFYESHDLFPDFMLNLGSGQNIYNISYYGLYNPIIMVSYLFPDVSMIDFLIISNILIVISSTILLYFYLRRKDYKELSCFIGALLFMLAGPIIYNSHHHSMFINYMPFLILALFGIDSYIKKHSPYLLITSLSMIIYCSYFFSVGAFIAVYVYLICLLFNEHKGNIRQFLLKCLRASGPFIISVFIGALILFPTLYVIIEGRASSEVAVTISDLLLPGRGLFYSQNSMGLTFFSFLVLIYFVLKGNKKTRILAIFLLVISTFPICSYILNGTMYINYKVLIPFIPLVIILNTDFIDKYFLNKTIHFKLGISSLILLVPLINCIVVNVSEEYISSQDYDYTLESHEEIYNYISDYDSSFYRISDLTEVHDLINYVPNTDVYKVSLYTSTSNYEYINFYYNILENNNSLRNNLMISTSSNIFSNIFLNEKYIITNNELDIYTLITEIDNTYIYENEYVMPFGYSTNNYINQEEYDSYTTNEKIINTLGNIITSEKETTATENVFIDKEVDFNIISQDDLEFSFNEEDIIIESNDGILLLEPTNLSEGELLLISFEILPNDNDQVIKINNISNKLTDISWKYYNDNTVFTYLITDPEELEIVFGVDTYVIKNISYEIISNDYLSTINDGITPLIIEEELTEGDYIYGNIELENSGIVTLSIPFDEGFIIEVDGKQIDYQNVNNGFIGFEVESGYHDIVISYEAPFKNISLYITCFTTFLVVSSYFITKKRKIRL